MSKIFYACAMILVCIWATGFFAFHAGIFIHVFPVIAVLSLVLSIASARQEKM